MDGDCVTRVLGCDRRVMACDGVMIEEGDSSSWRVFQWRRRLQEQ
jgi:hypothetical protein